MQWLAEGDFILYYGGHDNLRNISKGKLSFQVD
jgi:hypothetical protein